MKERGLAELLLMPETQHNLVHYRCEFYVQCIGGLVCVGVGGLNKFITIFPNHQLIY